MQEEVEFVLLDYSSTDGLYEWCKNLQEFIQSGILKYFRVENKIGYNRSHSRNMAMKLATGEIICNLDADNFLGENFAMFIIRLFEDKKNIFVTTNLLTRDAFGKACFLKKDFLEVRGYNECLTGYGVEDIDLFRRLSQKGLRQIVFRNQKYYGFIPHGFKERIINDTIYKRIYKVYVNYCNYYRTNVLIIFQDQTYLKFYLDNNRYYYSNIEWSGHKLIDIHFNDKNKVIISGEIEKGHWEYKGDRITFIEENMTGVPFKQGVLVNKTKYYELEDELKYYLISLYSDAMNYRTVTDILQTDHTINPSGFGMGVVYKNFSTQKTII